MLAIAAAQSVHWSPQTDKQVQGLTKRNLKIHLSYKTLYLLNMSLVAP